MTKRLEAALALRDVALALVKERGAWQSAPPGKLLLAKVGDLQVAYRTPFQKFTAELSDATKYQVALRGSKLNKPYAIDVWHRNKKVLLVEWDEAGTTDVISYRSGDWERELAGLPAAPS